MKWRHKMLNVVICDDNLDVLQQNELVVKNYIKDNPAQNIHIALVTADPVDLMQFIDNSGSEATLYLLDIEFANSEVRGIDLALKVKRANPNAEVIFITTHEEFLPLTFKRKIEALDFIAKEDGISNLSVSIGRGINKAIQRLTREQTTSLFEYQLGYRKRQVSIAKINYLESDLNNQKIIIHTQTGLIEYRGMLADAVSELDKFYVLQKNLLVNIENIEEIEGNHIHFKDNSVLETARLKLNGLKKEWRP